MTHFQPIHDRVLIEAIKDPAEGLIIIRHQKESQDVINDGTMDHSDYRRNGLRGTIVAVGPGKYDADGDFIPTQVRPGQNVVFSNWNDWEDAPSGFYLIREADIWWTVNG